MGLETERITMLNDSCVSLPLPSQMHFFRDVRGNTLTVLNQKFFLLRIFLKNPSNMFSTNKYFLCFCNKLSHKLGPLLQIFIILEESMLKCFMDLKEN